MCDMADLGVSIADQALDRRLSGEAAIWRICQLGAA